MEPTGGCRDSEERAKTYVWRRQREEDADEKRDIVPQL